MQCCLSPPGQQCPLVSLAQTPPDASVGSQAIHFLPFQPLLQLHPHHPQSLFAAHLAACLGRPPGWTSSTLPGHPTMQWRRPASGSWQQASHTLPRRTLGTSSQVHTSPATAVRELPLLADVGCRDGCSQAAGATAARSLLHVLAATSFNPTLAVCSSACCCLGEGARALCKPLGPAPSSAEKGVC